MYHSHIAQPLIGTTVRPLSPEDDGRGVLRRNGSALAGYETVNWDITTRMFCIPMCMSMYNGKIHSVNSILFSVQVSNLQSIKCLGDKIHILRDSKDIVIYNFCNIFTENQLLSLKFYLVNHKSPNKDRYTPLLLNERRDDVLKFLKIIGVNSLNRCPIIYQCSHPIYLLYPAVI